jgi:hypothetical protein
MYYLFFKRSPIQYGTIKLQEIDYLRRLYERELGNVVSYYHNSVYYLKNTHILVRMLKHIDIPFHYDADRFIEIARARAPYVSNVFKLTSDINYGKMFDGKFYGPGNDEIIIYDENYINPYKAERNYRNIKAVNVVLHPQANLELLLPNGKINSTEVGLSVIRVDLALLAFQYRAFILDRMSYNNDSDGLVENHFIHKYVLPNMLYKQLDIAIMNRMMNLFYGAPMDDTLFRHPFLVGDYSAKLDKGLLGIIKLLKNRKIKYEFMLQMIPGISEPDMQYVLKLPDVAMTRQINWAMMISRLKIIKFLIDLGGKEAVRYNKMDIANLKIYLRRLMNEQVLLQVVKDDLLYDSSVIIDEILAL